MPPDGEFVKSTDTKQPWPGLCYGHPSAMKIVLQDKKSSLFFGRERWTDDASKAHVFPNSLNAINFVYANQWPNMQIILKDEQSQAVHAVPVPNH